MFKLNDSNDGKPIFKQIALEGLLRGSEMAFESKMNKGMWAHNNYLVFVQEGNKAWKNQESEWLAGEDEALFVKNGDHMGHRYLEDDFACLMFFVTGDLIREVVEENPQLPYGRLAPPDKQAQVLRLEVDHHLAAFFSSVQSYYQHDVNPSHALISLKFKELILHIFSGDANRELAQYFYSLYENEEVPLRRIMQDNFRSRLGLEEFAALTSRSLSSFKRDFQKTFNTSPGKWLIEQRLIWSKSLLQNSTKSVNEIAYESGFENPSHYIRSFKQKFGKTPNQYRKAEL